MAAGLLIAGTALTDQVLRQPLDDGVTTLLLLGADQGPPRGGSPLRARADAFHLLFVASDLSHATFVNVPRDAWVPVAGRGTTRINACLNGGPDTCVATVERLWGVDVDDWVVTSMLGMGRAFQEFGGVEIDVPRSLAHGGPDISPGVQRLQLGALTYARDRKNRPGGDFDRSAAQAELLIAAHRKVVADGVSVDEVMRVADILRRHTITSASTRDLLRYAFAATDVPPANVATVTLPGGTGRAGAASVVFLGGDAAGIVADAADDGRVGAG